MSGEGWGFSSPLRSFGFRSANSSSSSSAGSSSSSSSGSTSSALEFPASVRALAWLSPVPEKSFGTGPDTRRAIEQVVSQLGAADAEFRDARARVASAQQVFSEVEAHKRVLQAQIEAAVEVATSAGSTPQNSSNSVLAREMKTLIGRAQAVESELRDAHIALRAAEADCDQTIARLEELSTRKKSLEDKFMSFVSPSTPHSRKSSRTMVNGASGGRNRSSSGGGSSPLFSSTRDRRSSSPDSSGGRRLSRSRLAEGTPHDRNNASDASNISRESAQVTLAGPLRAYLECLRGDSKMARSQPPEGTPELSDEDRYESNASTALAAEEQNDHCGQDESVLQHGQANGLGESDPHLVTLVISADAEPPLLSLAPLAHPEAQTPLTPPHSSSSQRRRRVRIGDSVEFTKLQRSTRRSGGIAQVPAPESSCKRSSTMCVKLDIRSKLGTVLREDGTVTAVKPGSQAADAGVPVGWRITAVDGLCVSDEATFRKALAVAKKLALPAEGGDPTRTRWPFELCSPVALSNEACDAASMPPQYQEQPVEGFEWVLVCEVDSDASAGLQCLDVVVGVNGTSLAGLSFDEASSALENAAAPLILTVLRVKHKCSSASISTGHGSSADSESGGNADCGGGVGNEVSLDKSDSSSSDIGSRRGFNDRIEDARDDGNGNGTGSGSGGSTGSDPNIEGKVEGNGNGWHIGEAGNSGAGSGNGFANMINNVHGTTGNVNSSNAQGPLPIERSQSLQRSEPGATSEKPAVEVDADALAEPAWNSETDNFSEADVAAVTVMGFERGWALHALRATQRLSSGSSKVASADDGMMSAADLDAAIEYIVDNVDTMDSLVALQHKAQAAQQSGSSGTGQKGSDSGVKNSPNSLSSITNAGESVGRRSSDSLSDLTAGQGAGAELATKMLKVGVALAAAASSAKVAAGPDPMLPSEVAAVAPPPAPPPAPAAAVVDPELQKYKKMLSMGKRVIDSLIYLFNKS